MTRHASMAKLGPSLLPAAAIALCACNDAAATQVGRTVEELMQPETCEECHDNHYREWASSMHAYAAQDPVFLAMNRRGQEETGGELGDFCISCHAPMAVRMGDTTDGLNLDEVDDHLEGVTCYFCHNVESISDVHENPLRLPANNPLQLAMDTTMRGGVIDPKRPSAHGVAYSRLHDGRFAESARMCGTCHDIVTDDGVHLERTFDEWGRSAVAQPEGLQTCIACHMDSRDDLIANTDELEVGFRKRGFHSHLMPGVDTALTPFPDEDIQDIAIQCALANAVFAYVMVDPEGVARVRLEANVGHKWPTGASQDRRAWLQLKAFDDAGEMRVAIGDFADDEPLPPPGTDDQLWVMRDHIFDAEGEEVHMFWDAREVDDTQTLPIAVSGPAGSLPPPHYRERTFRTFLNPARVEVAVKIRPLGFDVIDDLVASGHFTAAEGERLKGEIKTYTINVSQVVWDREDDGDGTEVMTSSAPPPACPKRWLCALYPTRTECL